MSKFKMPEYHKQGIVVQMVPLIDIMLFTLILFIYISVYSQHEADLDISMPKSAMASDAVRTPGEIIINITRNGKYIVNNQTMDSNKLEGVLKDASALFPNQQIIIRADEQSYHKYVVTALDACARANIWDISFATIREGEQTP